MARLHFFSDRYVTIGGGAQGLGPDPAKDEFSIRIFDLETGPRPEDPVVVDIYLDPLATRPLFSPGLAYEGVYKTTPPPMVMRDCFMTIMALSPHNAQTTYRITVDPKADVDTGKLMIVAP